MKPESQQSSFKRIASIEVIHPGSDPDVDSDFATYVREPTLKYVSEKYGHVSNINTFQILKAKKAFKAMCTIYSVSFAEANKVSALIPDSTTSLADFYDPYSDFYADGADFRNATTGDEWTPIIDGALAIEGRIDSVGMHACGVVISAKPLADVAPTRVREGQQVTQWTYPELEAMGLIKMDFLGLDTVDLIQHAVENIRNVGKKAPSMPELIHGPMDDLKTYELLGRGETIGIFQLAGNGMVDLLKLMKPDNFMDVVACNALFRPGPMGMGSHTKYALRKNGIEKVEFPVHPEFKGSALEDILKDTYSLVVYQEQIIQIANKIAGMTLQEGDDLRKAMGKKKKAVMDSMRPKFFAGALANGFSDEAITALWDTIETFAAYGFNLSHSVAYGMNSYQTAWLKANYPKEFMAALIAQNVGNKEKTLVNLQEARRMGLRVGPVSANGSEVRVSPMKDGQEFDIVYGFAGLNSISVDSAKIIVEERNANGNFKSTQDFIERCFRAGITTKAVFERLAYAGAFDEFGDSRRGVIEAIPKIIAGAKTSRTRGTSLLGMMATQGGGSATLKISQKEFPFDEKLRLEADTIGLYISAHPMDKITPSDLGKLGAATISDLEAYTGKARLFRVVAIPTEITKKTSSRGGKAILVQLEDSTGKISGRIHRDLVKAIDKRIAQEKFKELYCKGQTELQELHRISTDENVPPSREELQKNRIYVFDIFYRPAWNEQSTPGVAIMDFQELALADDGRLPVRVRFPSRRTKNGAEKKLSKEEIVKALDEVESALIRKGKGEDSESFEVSLPLLVARYVEGEVTRRIPNEAAFDRAMELLFEEPQSSSAKKEGSSSKKTSKGELISGATRKKRPGAKSATQAEGVREWPPRGVEETIEQGDLSPAEEAKALNELRYFDLGRKSSKILATVRQVLGEYGVSYEDVDSGYAIPVDES